MNESTDRLLVDWLAEGPDRGPSHGLDRALAATRRTTQRPGWRIPERWVPTQPAIRPAVVPRPIYLVVVVALLAVALVGALVFVGSRPTPAPPFGLASNGSIVVGVDGHLWQANSDGSDARRLFIGEAIASSPVFSPDGTRLAFKTRGADRTPWSIWVADADGSNARSVTGEFPVVAAELDGIAWSPDNSAITFTSSDKGINRLYRVDFRGGPPQALTDKGGDRSHPAISPDGQWLAFQMHSRSGLETSALMVSRPDGTAERELIVVVNANSSFAASQWAAGSDRIAYFRSSDGSRDGSRLVATVDLEGRETVVSLPGENADNPSWSPDGKSLAYSTADGGVFVDLADPSSWIVIPRAFAGCAMTWSPDATALLALDGACSSLYVIPVDHPGARSRVDMPTGPIDIAAWQRIAP
jgi:hypothetical protein